MKTEDDYPNAFSFEMFDRCADSPGKTWLLNGLIALGEDSSWFGPPGSMKSSLLLDMAVSIALRRDWRGHPYNWNEDARHEPRATLYFALERADLVAARMGAYKTRDKPDVPLPIGLVSRPINLLDPTCVDQILETAWKFETVTGVRVGLIILDTFSKAIADGDEDKAQTQNLAAANLRRIHEGLEVHIATIGHTGKNPGAGERGSNAKEGHVDLQVQISGGDKIRTASVVKANDQANRPIATFQMEEITVVGKRADGTDHEPYTTAILAAATPALEARPVAPKRTTSRQKRTLDTLRLAIAARGRDGAVQVDIWKEELAAAGLLNLKAKNPRSRFKVLRDEVLEHLTEANGLVRFKDSLPHSVYPSSVPTSPP